MRWLIALFFLVSAVHADPVADRMQAAFDRWMGDHDISGGKIAIFKDGRLMNTPDDVPIELASLSKAVTAVCVLHLVDEKLLRFDTKIAGVLGRGPEDLTVSQLLTHSGGLWPDHTQGLWSVIRFAGDRTLHNALTLTVLDRGVSDRFVDTYFYSNDNYAVLASVIEAATQSTYQEACTARVFTPAGVSAEPSDKMLPFLAWGGWTMSVADYGRFHRYYFGPGSRIGKDPFAFPHVNISGGAFYGMGMVFRKFGEGHNIWHFGSHCFPGLHNSGSFAVRWDTEWSTVAAYDGCLDWDQMVALDGALAGAVYPR